MISKDEQLLVEAYKQIIEKMQCKCPHAKSPEKCDCDGCEDCKKNQKLDEGKKAKKPKPDFLDVDGDKNKKESLKKALKDKKEKGNFKDLHKKAMSNSKK